jgi:hypothetical protein
MRNWNVWAGIAALVVTAAAAQAQIDVRSDGSDGVFSPTSSRTINLNDAAVGDWFNSSPIPGRGIYDPNVHAVVFKYESVNIPAGVTVTFENSARGNPPVVWLVRTDATIAGIVDVSGKPWTSSGIGRPGPGGYAGGLAKEGGTSSGSAGFGPGGGQLRWPNNWGYAGGSFAEIGITADIASGAAGELYGSPDLLPLIGGSGGTAHRNGDGQSGGGGGGAILVAVGSDLTVNGEFLALGGNSVNFRSGSGSGGGIRLMSNRLFGTGKLRAKGGTVDSRGGLGRLRLETLQNSSAFSVTEGIGSNSIATPGPLFPPDNTPTVRVRSIEQVPVPANPRADLSLADMSLYVVGSTLEIEVETTFVPSNWQVRVRVVPRSGIDFWATAIRVSGNDQAAVYRASIGDFPQGISAIQAKAVSP